jgi:hypothetical protein
MSLLILYRTGLIMSEGDNEMIEPEILAIGLKGRL